MLILVMADLEMLVTDKTKAEDHDCRDEFIERVILLTETYEEWTNRDGAKWLFSDDLYDLLWNAYPWNAPIHEQTDFLTMFQTWIERADKKIVTSSDLKSLALEQDIHADYIRKDYPKLNDEWLNVLACSIDIKCGRTFVFSFGGKPDRLVLLIDNKESQQFPLIKDHNGWQSALAKTDPWIRHQLPKNGDHPYIPHGIYRTGDAGFPREFYQPRNAVGFKDIQGRLWVPDEERGQRHWDVQCVPYARDNYFKVSPDGRLLGHHKPC